MSAFPTAIRDPPGKLKGFVAELDAMTEGSSKKRKMRRVAYEFAPSGDTIYSYSVPFEDAYKKEGRLPSKARGLFVRKVKNDGAEIVVRGYDKFFNIGEVKATQWDHLEESTRAPYEMTLKENGCIIFVAAIDGHLAVTSKHALGQPREDGQPYAHAQKGEEWLDIHLQRSGRSRNELAKFLGDHNATAVFELTDDDFEEHVLEYPPERRGLHLHGVNFNTIEFKTWPADAIHRFSEHFGFVKVGVVMKNSLQEVKALADECAQTGSYGNRPIEGFVVRCNTKDSREGDFENYFFKVKFDEPYLMYREWREVTKQLLKERQPFKNYRYELTYKYVEFVRRKMKSQPELFENFLQNKGIIHARNLFLEEAGITNPERYAHMLTAEGKKEDAAAAGAANDSDGGDDNKPVPARSGENSASVTNGKKTQKELRGSTKTLLLPIACIGCGKTTLGLVLSELYGIGHVQNDNITAKKNPGDHFNKAVLEQFLEHDVVFADRNNHLRIHRSNLSQAIRTELPGCKIVALHWDVDPEKIKEILDVTVKRVVDRGENHQSLTPGRNQNFKAVMSSFIKQRDPLDLKNPADKMIDEVVEMEVENSIEENVRIVAEALGLEKPDPEKLEKAVAKSLEYKPTVIKEMKGQGPGVPRYFALRFDNVSLRDVLGSQVFGDRPKEERAFFDELVKGERIADKHHITLAFVGEMAKKFAKLKDTDDLTTWNDAEADKARLFRYFQKALADRAFPPTQTGAVFPPDTLSTEFTIERVIWDGRVMVLPVSELAIECENEHPHITVGTASDAVKNVESNVLLKGIGKGSVRGWKELKFAPLQIRGTLEAMWS